MKKLESLHDFYNFFASKDNWCKWETHGNYGARCAIGHLSDVENNTAPAYNLGRAFTKAFFLGEHEIMTNPIARVNDYGPHKNAKDNILEAIQMCAEMGIKA